MCMICLYYVHIYICIYIYAYIHIHNILLICISLLYMISYVLCTPNVCLPRIPHILWHAQITRCQQDLILSLVGCPYIHHGLWSVFNMNRERDYSDPKIDGQGENLEIFYIEINIIYNSTRTSWKHLSRHFWAPTNTWKTHLSIYFQLILSVCPSICPSKNPSLFPTRPSRPGNLVRFFLQETHHLLNKIFLNCSTAWPGGRPVFFTIKYTLI